MIFNIGDFVKASHHPFGTISSCFKAYSSWFRCSWYRYSKVAATSPELAMAEMGKSANQLGLVNIAMSDYQKVVRVSSSYISSGKTHKFNGKNVCSF